MLKKNPSLNHSLSSWTCKPRTHLTMTHGALTPVRSWLVLPGDYFGVTQASLIEMAVPKKPFLQDIEAEFDAFFIPMRLVWEHTEEFFGANKLTAGASPVVYQVPSIALSSMGVPYNSVSHYVGKPITAFSPNPHVPVSILKERAYYLVYNNYYRASMLQNPCVINRGDIGVIGTNQSGMPLDTSSPLLQVNKNLDYFTASLQQPLYGSNGVPVSFGISGVAPLRMFNDTVPAISSYTNIDSIKNTDNILYGQSSPIKLYDSTDSLVQADLKAVLSNLNASFDIEVLRKAIFTENYLEHSQFAGNTYWGQMLAHYGVSPADKSLQIPQYLGRIKFDLNMSRVTQMATTFDNNGAAVPAGNAGASSITGNKEYLFSKSFDEFGFVLILGFTRIKKHTYFEGVAREDLILNHSEFFAPEFNGLGDDGIYKAEIFYDVPTSTARQYFGYQEHDAYLKYFVDESKGCLNPNAGSGVAINDWTFDVAFGSIPTLNSDFVTEKRAPVSSKLIGENANYDYICSFEFEMKVAREVSLGSLAKGIF